MKDEKENPVGFLVHIPVRHFCWRDHWDMLGVCERTSIHQADDGTQNRD